MTWVMLVFLRFPPMSNWSFVLELSLDRQLLESTVNKNALHPDSLCSQTLLFPCLSMLSLVTVKTVSHDPAGLAKCIKLGSWRAVGLPGHSSKLKFQLKMLSKKGCTPYGGNISLVFSPLEPMPVNFSYLTVALVTW